MKWNAAFADIFCLHSLYDALHATCEDPQCHAVVLVVKAKSSAPPRNSVNSNIETVIQAPVILPVALPLALNRFPQNKIQL